MVFVTNFSRFAQYTLEWVCNRDYDGLGTPVIRHGHLPMKGLIIALFLGCIFCSPLAFSDRDGFSPDRLLVSIYNNSPNSCTLLSTTILSGGLFSNNRVPIYIPAGHSESFVLLASRQQRAMVRLSYECGADHRITFISSSDKTAKPAARGAVENYLNMAGYSNVALGVNARSIYWILEVSA